MLGGDVPDEFHDEDRLAHAGAAEQPDLAALGVGCQQVDDLQSGFQNLGGGFLFHEGRRVSVNGIMGVGLDWPPFVDGISYHVDDTA